MIFLIDGQNHTLITTIVSQLLLNDKIISHKNDNKIFTCCNKNNNENNKLIYLHTTCPYTLCKMNNININMDKMWHPNYVIYIYNQCEKLSCDNIYEDITCPYNMYKINGDDDWYFVYSHVYSIILSHM
jgi:hypothetical protein